ncbi:alpha/beta hydrolase [Catellatospora sp. IY07-71]|nr:alpha/beta hydrolase [Catellatospora sp. IY07-71]
MFDAGDAGHIESASGHGPWPDGDRLAAALAT